MRSQPIGAPMSTSRRWSDPLLKLSKEYQTRGKGKKSGKVKTNAEPKKNKYGNIRTASGFPSHLEEAVYADLLYQQKAGLLRDVERYPSVHLGGKLRWKCDFKAFDVALNQIVFIEAKGVEDGRFIAIKQVWPVLGPGLMRIYKGRNGRVYVDEEIEGKK